ncbi:hypothetical protein KAH37_00730, partial [bacterium]|nr:hypothetical protein [bacterium]
MWMKQLVLMTIFLLFSLLSGVELPKSATTTITPQQSLAIINAIVNKYSVMYQKYDGVEYDRHLTVDWLYVGTKKVAKTEKVVYHRTNYFYDHIGFKTLLYEVDGKA